MIPTLQEQQALSGRPLIIWRLTDGKPGHENQSLGLCNALARKTAVARHDIPLQAQGRISQLLQWLTGRFPAGRGLPAPDLVIGAGHRTHLALLAARRAFGGKAVVIMKPSLPLSLFDLCVIPEHDDVTGDNVFVTRGGMNTVTVTAQEERSQVLILLGGPSRHYTWQDEVVISQVEAVVREQPERHFILSDSRRTPAACMEKIAALGLINLTMVPWQQTGPGWVANQLGLSQAIWVSEDSVSMVYEAITSGAAVGLIALQRKQASRIAVGVGRLIADGWVTPFQRWRETGKLTISRSGFNEADRCASWMVEQWL